MVKRNIGTAALMFFMLAAQAEDLDLAYFIPTEKWEKVGISKLTDSERMVLRDEIVALLQRHRASFTDGGP